MAELLSMHSPLPYFGLSAYFALLMLIPLRRIAFYRKLVAQNPHRNTSLDSLRGFLALGVFFHHSVIAYYEQKTGVWTVPPTRFYTLLGQVGVSMFFMLTGYLFWAKALAKGGWYNPFRLYWTRFLRLTPTYAASVAFVLMAMAIPWGVHSLKDVNAGDFESLLTFHGLLSAGSINNAYWTLPWEWIFYLFLPLAALFARGYRQIIPAAALMAYILHDESKIVLFNFICGGLAASLIRKYPLRPLLISPVGTLLAIVSLSSVFIFFDSGYGYTQLLLMAVFFLCIAAGNSLFGLLHLPAVLLLGTISYSIYLLHCTVNYLVIQSLNRFFPVASLSEPAYWLVTFLQGDLVLLLALPCYRYFEHPFFSRSHENVRS